MGIKFRNKDADLTFVLYSEYIFAIRQKTPHRVVMLLHYLTTWSQIYHHNEADAMITYIMLYCRKKLVTDISDVFLEIRRLHQLYSLVGYGTEC